MADGIMTSVVGKDLRLAQENVIIAALRRPSLVLWMKGTGLHERHFPRDLQPAFHVAVTKSQDEIRRLVMVEDTRVWPLYGKRIIEWNEAQAREAARQIVHSVRRSEDRSRIDAVCHNDGSSSAAAAEMAAPTYETPEKQSVFVKTLAAIREIIGDREEIASRAIVDELTRIEGGPWAEWGRGRDKKPITQNALGRLLRPHNVSPTDVGPEHARRKGYKRAQFEGLFAAHLGASPPVPYGQPRSRAGGDAGG